MLFRMKFGFAKPLCIVVMIAFLAGCTTPAERAAWTTPEASDAAVSTRSARTSSLNKADSSGDWLPILDVSPRGRGLKTIDLTFETDDLLQRVRNGFSMPDIYSDLVLSQQQWYMNRPDYLRRAIERGRPYMYHIVDELEKRGMPMELVFLPMVESAYNPMALSSAKASGLWQFMPATGKRFNLGQNWWQDERRDILASTSAALDYLQTIYEMHGDWHLALASYNWGEGSVARAINKNRVNDLPTDYLSLSMPDETKNYVPKLQALKNIFSNPSIFAELGIPKVANHAYFETVSKPTPIDIKLAAKLAEMPIEEFVALNPSHNRPVIRSDTPMVIPTHKLDTFMSNLEEHEESNKPLSAWQSYTLRPGDKLEKIAPRFGMTVANLKAINGISGRIKVRPGSTLLVAGNGDMLEAGSGFEAQALTQSASTYVIKKGDTLPAIAKKHGLTVAELKRINKLSSDKIKAGARLRLAQSAEKKPPPSAQTQKNTRSQAANKPAKSTLTSAKNPVQTRYTVRKGDTLFSISRQFKVSVNELVRLNRTGVKPLIPGKSLVIR